jgi:hypothetical protein
VLSGTYKRAGISPPSYLGEAPGCASRIFVDLHERGIVLAREDKILE